MLRVLAVGLCCLIGFSSCSKVQRGKWNYKRGNYKKAVMLLELAARNDASNVKAATYLVLAQSGLKTDQAAEKIKTGDFESSLALLNDAINLDPKNEDAHVLFKEAVEKTAAAIENAYLPAGDWKRVLSLCDAAEANNADNAAILISRAKALLQLEKGVHTYRVVMALEKASQKAPDDPFVKKELERVRAFSVPFAALFQKYQQALVTKNVAIWKSIIQPKYQAAAEAVVKEFADMKYDKIRNLNEYFNELCNDLTEYGSPQGGELVCVEPLSETHGFVHFTYTNLPKIIRMEIEPSGGVLKLYKEEDSPIVKP